MKLNKSKPPTWAKRIKQLWQANIPNLKNLKLDIQGAVLVALDVRFSCPNGCRSDLEDHGLIEIGFAVLPVKDFAPTFRPGLRMFYDWNGVQAYNFRLPGNKREKMEIAYGSDVRVTTAEEARAVMSEILSHNQGPRILVGFNLWLELKWIAEAMPALASEFNSWVDVQDLATQRCQNNAPLVGSCKQIGFTKALQAMHIANGRPDRKFSRPANDAVRCLVLLSGLVDNAVFTIPGHPSPPEIYTGGPPPVHIIDPDSSPNNSSSPSDSSSILSIKPRFFWGVDQTVTRFNLVKIDGISIFRSPPKANYEKHPFVVRVTTNNGSQLPAWSPELLAINFSHFPGLKAVWLDWPHNRAPTEGIQSWWLSFKEGVMADYFRDTMNGVGLVGFTEDTELRVNLEEYAPKTKGKAPSRLRKRTSELEPKAPKPRWEGSFNLNGLFDEPALV